MSRLLSSGGLVGAAGGRVDSLPMILLHCAEVPATLPARVTKRWLSRLPAARAATLARELGAGRGLESLTGLALLAGCTRFLPLPPLSQLTENPGGKPCWREGPDFSIAHAAGWVVCAVAPPGIAIGVDLEPVDGANLEFLRLVTSAAERRLVREGAFSAAALWTCKEAVLKAASRGVTAAGQVEIEGAVGHHAGRDYYLERLDFGRLVLAIATTARIAKPRVVRADASTLFDLLPIGDSRSTA